MARQQLSATGGSTNVLGRFAPVFAAAWLIYLSIPWSTAWSTAPGPGRTLSLVSVVGFGAVYLAAIFAMRVWRRGDGQSRRMPYAWAYLVLQAVLAAGIAVQAHSSALTSFVFMAVTAVFTLAGTEAFAVVAVLVAASESVPRLVPGWEPLDSAGVQIALAAAAVFGFTQVMRRNVELARARLELADLAVARERERIARDVHDLLGHSLTVITVKSELAGRLLEVDPSGAAREIADIEALARSALADVRATLHGVRSVGLASELASARAALDAAGIEAQIPSAVDAVPDGLRELFAWAVREAVTNVVRHSGARRCEILLAGRTLVVRDDGRGPQGVDTRPEPETGKDHVTGGSGLAGLHGRAMAAGASLTAGRSPWGGFELRVDGSA
ncbi:MAG: sensor histidine kinase [Cellulomonas sp.]